MTSINKLGADWLLTKAFLKTKIDDARSNMERGQSMEEYHFSRGVIAMCKALIEEVEPTTPPQTHEDDYEISRVNPEE